MRVISIGEWFFSNKKVLLNNNFLNPQPKVVRIKFFGEISRSGV